MINFTTLKNRCAIIATPESDILAEIWAGQWQCAPVQLAWALGYGDLDTSNPVSNMCKKLGESHRCRKGHRILLTKVVELVLPNIANALMERYKSREHFLNRVWVDFYEFENNAQVVKEKIVQFLDTNEPTNQLESEQEDKAYVDDKASSDLCWEDYESLAAWMAEEIAGIWSMDKKSYRKQPPHLPPRLYRVPVSLAREDRLLFAMLIKRMLWHFWETGKTSDFNWQVTLRRISRQIGLRGEPILYLRALCRTFVEDFPNFVKLMERRIELCGYMTSAITSTHAT